MRLARNVSRALGLAAGAGAAWSLFEAQWVELKELDVPIEGLPAELDGFRVLHLSDFHLGSISFNGRALRKATDWAVSDAPPECRGQSQGQSPTRGTRGHGSNVEDKARERAMRAGDFTRDVAAPDVLGGQSQGQSPPRKADDRAMSHRLAGHGWGGPDAKGGFDLVAITGDLLSRRRGALALRVALAQLPATHGVYAVLGNHDIGETRDPFVDTRDPPDLPRATLLLDDAQTFEARGRRIQLVGVDPRTFAERRAHPQDLADPAADLRILLCHFPDVADVVPPNAFHLILAGHLHGGQICVPTPWGRLGLEHLRAAHWHGLHRTPAGPLYVSRGLGTSFVPFRFLARPEATGLTLRVAS